MNKFWELFFYVFSWFAQGSSYLNARAYAILHRMHHAYSDTEEDPHTPHFFNEVFSMSVHTAKVYHSLATGTLKAGSQFQSNDPVYPVIDRIADHWLTRIAFGLFYTLFYISFATHWWMFLLLPIHYLMGPVHGAIVNWAGHKYGYRNFDQPDKSRNTVFIDVLLLGELFQNNHHHNGKRPNFATRWWEFDPVYPVIKLFDRIHIIELAKRDPAPNS